MRIYSNAAYIEEADDVVGIELAFNVQPDSSVNALLYDYEGAPNMNGAPLVGRMAGKTLTIEGKWVQNLQDSSGKETVRTAPHNAKNPELGAKRTSDA